jgi:hypothetical protein
LLLLKYHLILQFISSCSQVQIFTIAQKVRFYINNLLMLLGSDGVSAWTTRFGIAGSDGKLATETNSTQPNGDAIPWGTGKLLSNASASASASSSIPATAASSSVAPAASAAASSADVVAAVASPSAVESSSATPVPSVAQVVSNTNANSGSMVKPALTLVSAAAAAYFAL